MIPKIIHYIWLGGKELPDLDKECIESWKKYCPDYEIKRWDESNLNLDFCDYVREAYDNKKYAFASDVLRLDLLYRYGGIYLDVDVKIIKPIDKFLENKCFGGFEGGNQVNPGIIFGCEAGNEDIKNIIESYKQRHFVVDGKVDQKTICETFTEYYSQFGLERVNKTQVLPNITVYAMEYFCPIDIVTSKTKYTSNTHAVHLYNASWYSPWGKVKKFVKKVLNIFTFGLFGKVVLKVKSKEK